MLLDRRKEFKKDAGDNSQHNRKQNTTEFKDKKHSNEAYLSKDLVVINSSFNS